MQIRSFLLTTASTISFIKNIMSILILYYLLPTVQLKDLLHIIFFSQTTQSHYEGMFFFVDIINKKNFQVLTRK